MKCACRSMDLTRTRSERSPELSWESASNRSAARNDRLTNPRGVERGWGGFWGGGGGEGVVGAGGVGGAPDGDRAASRSLSVSGRRYSWRRKMLPRIN